MGKLNELILGVAPNVGLRKDINYSPSEETREIVEIRMKIPKGSSSISSNKSSWFERSLSQAPQQLEDGFAEVAKSNPAVNSLIKAITNEDTKEIREILEREKSEIITNTLLKFKRNYKKKKGVLEIFMDILQFCVLCQKPKALEEILKALKKKGQRDQLVAHTMMEKNLVRLFISENFALTNLEGKHLQFERKNIFHIAANGSINCLKTLIQELPKSQHLCRAKDYHHQTPMHIAAANSTVPCFELLYEYLNEMKCLDTRDHFGNTPLHYAVKSGMLESLFYILPKINKNPSTQCLNKINKKGKSPIFYAQDNKSLYALLIAGADPTKLDDNKQSLLEHFLKFNPDNARALMNYEVSTNGKEITDRDFLYTYNLRLFLSYIKDSNLPQEEEMQYTCLLENENTIPVEETKSESNWYENDMKTTGTDNKEENSGKEWTFSTEHEKTGMKAAKPDKEKKAEMKWTSSIKHDNFEIDKTKQIEEKNADSDWTCSLGHEKIEMPRSANVEEGKEEIREEEISEEALQLRPETMVISKFSEYQQSNLLTAPVAGLYVFCKWSMTRYLYYAYCLWYLIYLGAMTGTVFWASYEQNHPNGTNKSCRFNRLDFKIYGDDIVGHNFWITLYWTSYVCTVLLGVKMVWKSLPPTTRIYRTIPGYGRFFFAFFYLNYGKFTYDINCNALMVFGALALFLNWVEMSFLIGRTPKLGIFIVMCKSVLIQLSQFLLVYLPTLIAFACTFTIILPNSDVFENLFTSILKLVVMMVGEYEFEKNFTANGVTERSETFRIVATMLIFLVCVLMVTFLGNLMMGLVIENISEMKKDAEKHMTMETLLHVQQTDDNLFHRCFSKFISNALIKIRCNRQLEFLPYLEHRCTVKLKTANVSICFRPNESIPLWKIFKKPFYVYNKEEKSHSERLNIKTPDWLINNTKKAVAYNTNVQQELDKLFGAYQKARKSKNSKIRDIQSMKGLSTTVRDTDASEDEEES